MNPGERFIKYSKLYEQATELFHIVQSDNGNVGIHFDDTIDSVYIGINFARLNGFPYIETLNSIQFEEMFGKINQGKTVIEEKQQAEIEGYTES